MKKYNFTQELANQINNYQSIDAFYTKIMKTVEPANIGFIYIEPGGVVGMHEAPVPQLFIVIQGEGWVCGEDQEKIILKAGEGVLWQTEEAHESGSQSGLTALVIQSEPIHLA
ncbi:cupin [Lysinibacillus sp. KCTC 33748]|uniref:cupin domain-containing protein n=1 Tax=unclassified Lysinibacillus TaxID=2636778 RepID=UPI0009A7B29E|nr:MULTISPECIES: cupin domain-containing protein [unclassified Lysinibacillus]OXS73057.1 cupin [Lysinibacillus sp. KCTC 33748]SKB86812.1 Cupin domain-containing protein [Lysinibacillus sp. AC-3]